MPLPSELKDNNFKPTIFNRIQEEIDARSGDQDPIIPLHVGDTWFDLPEELFIPLESEPWNKRLSRYGDTQGEPELRNRLAAKIIERNNIPISGPEEVQITYGGSGGLFTAMRKLFEPGAEILTLAPYWVILKVVASSAGVELVEVPIFDNLPEQPDQFDFEALCEPYLTDKTAGIYFNNPNNPSGVLLRKGHLEQIAEFAKEHDLWVLSDEAYEDFVWVDEPYISIASLPGMFERTVSVFTMSKSYAAAGLRLGCNAAPKGVIASLNPVNVGSGYEPNRLAQVQWIRGIERHEEIIKRLRNSYQECLAATIANLDVPYLRPEGSFYLFLDLRERWDGLSADDKLESMFKAGVVMSLGEAFGKHCEGWARFCFVAEKPERIAEAARRVNRI
ncbi:MAG: pyridoxal phosphate-dependent aminotransferase [Candidatus Electryonea clarkiae]|nr:pyridoxal phosphate-dependent aminotransferase [Candidatus Electryonea clarkiae]MDP8288385.1 pyridoxal phosphate-dependent aminotransferase [Candidatus Electryonea clarkiae]